MFRYPFQLAFGAAFGDAATASRSAGLAETLAAPRHRATCAPGTGPLSGAARRAGGRGRPRSRRGGGRAGRRVRRRTRRRGRAAARAPAGAAGRPDDWQRVDQREKAQTAFAMAFPGPDRRDPKRARSRGLGRGGERTRRPAVRCAAGPALAGLHRGGDGVAEARAGRCSPTSPPRPSARTRRARRCWRSWRASPSEPVSDRGTARRRSTTWRDRRRFSARARAPWLGKSSRRGWRGGTGGTRGSGGALPAGDGGSDSRVAAEAFSGARAEGVVRGSVAPSRRAITSSPRFSCTPGRPARSTRQTPSVATACRIT